MITAISNATQAQPVARSAGPSTSKATASAPKPAASTDSAQLSQAAQAMLAALQEVAETSTQTAKEAGSGDMQAQRLLAKEAVANSASK